MKFSERLNKVIEQAQKFAFIYKQNEFTDTQLLFALLSPKTYEDGGGIAFQIFDKLKLPLPDLSFMEYEFSEVKKINNTDYKRVRPDIKANNLLLAAEQEALSLNSNVVGTEHLLLAGFKIGFANKENLFLDKEYTKHISYKDIVTAYKEIRYGRNKTGIPNPLISEIKNLTKENAQQSKNNKSKEKSKTPVLDNFSRDLTKLALQGKLDPVIGRTKEIERLAQVLSRRKKNNPVLIGEPGVGKTAIVEGLALRIVEKKVSRSLFDKRLLSLDLAAIVAGTKYRGQFEERMRTILLELEKANDIILFIDELHTLVGAGDAQGGMDASNMFKPALARGELQCIGATTIAEYRKFIEKDGALERRFQKVIVEQPNTDETQQIINNIKERYEIHHHVQYTSDALYACVQLADRYITDRMFPDKAIDILDEAGARVHISNIIVPQAIIDIENKIAEIRKQKTQAIKEQKFEDAAEFRDKERKLQDALNEKNEEWEKTIEERRLPVTEYDVSDVVAMMTGIPVNKIAASESQKLLHLSESLEKHIIGQKEAIEKLANAIKRSRSGLKDPHKPIGSFMFLGSTGVGKTELAKVLAQEMFDNPDALIRVDMSEYMEKFNVSRLVGAPPGYVGYEEGGQLTEKVRKKPYSIVLLDEIEKAHPDVFNVLLQILDDGEITDSLGRKINFRNTVIIMTSNAGTKDIKAGGKIGFSDDIDTTNYDNMKQTVESAMKNIFNPEFLNRIDDFIYFRNLTKEDIVKIVKLKISELISRMQANNIELNITDDAVNFIADKGYDEKNGARPLQRQIQLLLENPLSELVLEGNLPPSESVLCYLDANENKLNFATSNAAKKYTEQNKEMSEVSAGKTHSIISDISVN